MKFNRPVRQPNARRPPPRQRAGSTGPPVPPPGRIALWTGRLNDYRPLAVVGLGIVYAVGYLARGVHAWENSLGLQPWLDFQNFVAGVLLLSPLAALAGACFGAREMLRRLVKWEAAVAGRSKRVDNILIGGMGASLFPGFAAASLLKNWLPELKFLQTATMFSTVGLFFAYVAVVYMRGDPDPAPSRGTKDNSVAKDTPGGWRKMFHAAIKITVAGATWLYTTALLMNMALMVIAIVSGAILYGLVFLPQWPQELGGARPDCVVADVKIKSLSPDLARELLQRPVDDNAISKGVEVWRTRELAVYFASKEALVIRLPASDGIGRRTLELKRDIVVATTGCPATARDRAASIP